MKKLFAGFLLLFICNLLAGQEKLDSQRVAQKTLHHFYQKEWKPLINLGNRALNDGIDFKYLRYRMGIAHYESGHYNLALPHFRLVEKQSPSDTVLQEYQYYSYLFGGRSHDAAIFAEKMDASVRKKVGFKKFRLIDEINFNVGGKFSSLTDSAGHMPIVSLGMSHQLGTRLRYTHQFTFLTQNYLGLQYNQFEYYGKAELALAKAIQLVAAFHYTTVNGNASSFDSILGGEVLLNEDVTQKGLIGLLGFQGNFGALKWKAYASLSNWQSTSVSNGNLVSSLNPSSSPFDTSFLSRSMIGAVQYGLELDYRIPISKNSWISAGAHFAMQHQRFRVAPVWGAKLYAQLSPKAGVGVSFLRAATTYFIADDASFASNTIGVLNAQVATTFNYQLTPKLNWHINYTYENRNTQTFNFNYHSIFTGLKFRL